MPRETDEQDSTWALVGNYVMALLVTGGLIALDFLTDKGIWDGTLIGMVIIKVWDGVTKQNDYLFPSRRPDTKQHNGGNN